MRGSSVNLSGVTFFGWGADDTVVIEGTSTIVNTLIGSNQADDIDGNFNSADTITGGDGADTLVGGGGIDTFRYLSGGDADAGEVVDGGASTDTIRLENAGAISFAAVTITDVETLDFVSGNSTATFESNEFGKASIGFGDVVTVSGSVGVDAIVVNTVAQIADLSGLAFNNWTNGTDTVTINGSGLQDLINGSTQNDLIDGKGGVDIMSGGLGNDTYVVDVNEAIIEAAGEGTDLVQSAVTFTLAANFENLTLTGAAAINGTGNGLANAITGNSAANQLNGGAQNDTLNGFGGNDRLDGGSRVDTMSGGNGDDTYIVDNAGDTASEASGSGVDRVESTVTFTLAAGIENLVLNGTAAINGTGNAGVNAITGNSAANTLSGLAANDTLPASAAATGSTAAPAATP